MRVWIGRMPAAVCWLVLSAAVGAAPPGDQLQSWIGQLNSEDFATREAAVQRLASAGEAAIEPLAAAIASGDCECAWRATAALEQIALHGNDATLRRAAARLQELSAAGKPGLATVAGELHARRAKQRHDRAAAKIRALGGRFAADGFGAPLAAEIDVALPPIVEEEASEDELPAKVSEPVGIEALDTVLKSLEALLAERPADAKPHPLPDPPPDLPLEDAAAVVELPLLADVFIADAFVGAEFVESERLENGYESLMLDQSWRGGDKGMAALRDLTGLTSLSLHHAPLTDAALDRLAALPSLAAVDAEGMPFSSEAWARFRQRRPSTRIFARGEALLGVSADITGPCVVTSVVAGSGASQAGLKPGDQITAVGGEKVHDFSDLTIAISAHKPGEQIRVDYRRNGQQQTGEIVLKSRKDIAAAP